MNSLVGSCLCRKVSYRIVGVPDLMYHCHCGVCRKASGTSFATNIITRAKDFIVLTGGTLLSSFESCPRKFRYFCSNCGSPIFGQSEATRHLVSVRSGTLDSDPPCRPSVHLYVDSKAPWVELTDGLARRKASLE